MRHARSPSAAATLVVYAFALLVAGGGDARAQASEADAAATADAADDPGTEDGAHETTPELVPTQTPAEPPPADATSVDDATGDDDAGEPDEERELSTAAPDRPLRIAVYDFKRADIPAKWGSVVLSALLTELRKLQRVNVIGIDEVRAMLGMEAEKAALGCDEDSCLTEIADALDVDVIVVGSLSKVGAEHVFALRRISQVEAKVDGGITRRFKDADGEAFLAAIGPAVGELFPERPLRPGAKRGVDPELGLLLNPPPIPTWVFWSATVATGAVALGATAALAANIAAIVDVTSYKTAADPFVVETFNQKALTADVSAYAFYGLVGVTLVGAATVGVLALFTDFWGYGDAMEGQP